MKLSLAWIFDYIDIDFASVDVPALIEKFNRTTAEIETCHKVDVDLKRFKLAQVQSIDANCIVLMSPEGHEEIVLPVRRDVQKGKWYLVKQSRDMYRWAIPMDFGKDKEGYLPEFYVDSHLADGGWKKQVDACDYILEIDNKSITNRPDLWCHRGFAREIAAILQVPFEPLNKYVKKIQIDQHDSKADAIPGNPFSIEIKTPDCRRFAGLYIDQIKPRPSSLWMGIRLLRVGVSSISFYVDITNYVMFDIGEPMHAFDAVHLPAQAISVRKAKKGEKLILLDDAELELTDQDMVVCDGDKIVSLAGIMGGKNSGISDTTSTLFFEAANFDATTIRRSATRFKVRTESSMRFEKSLDPNQNIIALERTLKLMDDEHIEYKTNDIILSVGKPAEDKHVKVTHSFIEKSLGTPIPTDFIETTLLELQFVVTPVKTDGDIIYDIMIPPFRATKDISLREDIVEEIGRFWGYDKIPYLLPTRDMAPSKNQAIVTKYNIKHHMAFALHMHEVNNYPVYDEQWLSKLGFDPEDAVTLKNRLSENAKRLASSLVPHLLRNIEQNKAHHNKLRFFELARRWWMTKKEAHEQATLASVCWASDGKMDFYDIKQELVSLFTMLRVPVKWVKAQGNLAPWYSQQETAFLMYEDKCIGVAGMADAKFLGQVAPGNAFIVELDAGFMLSYQAPAVKYSPLSKYPHVWLDISLYSDRSHTVDELLKSIKHAHENIYKVELKDRFHKKEWGDNQALTLRFYIRDKNKTLDKQDIDAVYQDVEKVVKKRGIEIR